MHQSTQFSRLKGWVTGKRMGKKRKKEVLPPEQIEALKDITCTKCKKQNKGYK